MDRIRHSGPKIGHTEPSMRKASHAENAGRHHEAKGWEDMQTKTHELLRRLPTRQSRARSASEVYREHNFGQLQVANIKSARV